MKIAFIGQKGVPATWGGVEQHVEKLAPRIASLGVDVVVYNRAYYAEKAVAQKFADDNPGLKVVTLPTLRSKHFDAIVHTFIATVHAIIKERPDIYHYQGVGPSLLAWMPRLFHPRARVVTTFHSPDRLHQKWGWFARMMLTLGEWAALTCAHRTIAVSRALQSYALERYQKEAHYIPNGVLLPERKAAGAMTHAFGLHADEYILMVSRLIPHKGAHYLIEAFKKIDTEKKLVIVGDSSYTDDYVQELKELVQDDDRIIFTGYQTGEMLAELFSNAYLYVQPSESEGLSIAVLEAASYGNAVLASDIDANAEVVEEDGLLFRNKDIDDLQKQLIYALQHPHVVAASGKRLKAHVAQAYNWENIADDTYAQYWQLLDDVQSFKHVERIKEAVIK